MGRASQTYQRSEGDEDEDGGHCQALTKILGSKQVQKEFAEQAEMGEVFSRDEGRQQSIGHSPVGQEQVGC